MINFKKKKLNMEQIISIIFLVSVSVPLIFLIIDLILSKNLDQNKLLMIIVSVLVLIAFFVPAMIEKKFNLKIPIPIYISFVVFLYSAAILGEIKRFYYIYPFWDTILHFFSGLIIGILGFSVIYLLNKSTKNIKLSPFFIAFFAFCFANTCGICWELFEYANDLFLETNMQKYMFENGKNLIGQLALRDTMNDIITNFLGALISSFIGYLSIKNEKKWFNDLLIIKK